MHGGDHRMRHPVDRLDRRVHALHDPCEILPALRRRRAEIRGERADVSARHEMPSGSADDDAAHAVIGGERHGVDDQRVHHRQIQRC